MMTAQGRTHRSPDGMWAGPGAVRQHDGKLPIYVCNTCGRDVVWATSKRTGRKYLANIARGQGGARFYLGASIHDCGADMARRAEALREAENDRDNHNHSRYLLHLIEQHRESGHAATVDQCTLCEREL